MDISSVLKVASGRVNLRGVTLEDLPRFIRYAVADGQITATEGLFVHEAVHAAGWLLATGRLVGATHMKLKAMVGVPLVKALQTVFDRDQTKTLAGYASQWTAILS